MERARGDVDLADARAGIGDATGSREEPRRSVAFEQFQAFEEIMRDTIVPQTYPSESGGS